MEQESIFQELPAGKLFKSRSIYIATFLGGPVVAGYLISSNYKALNEQHNTIKTWIFTFIGIVLILFFSSLINYNSSHKIPALVLPLIYSIITYNIVNLAQREKIKAYISKGGQFHSLSRIVIVTIIGLALTLVGFLVIENIIDLEVSFGLISY
jgi:hypothetical protein